MTPLVSFSLDLVLIGLLIGGIVMAIKLTHQLTGLRQSRAEMERFIVEFSSTVGRAEAGIRGLKQAARSGGDDLEKLIERALILRDEMTYLIDSADQAANRVTETVAKSAHVRPKADPTAQAPEPAAAPKPHHAKPAAEKAAAEPAAAGTPQSPASGAERELLRALGKLR